MFPYISLMRQITKIGTERKGSKILLNVNIERFFYSGFPYVGGFGKLMPEKNSHKGTKSFNKNFFSRF